MEKSWRGGKKVISDSIIVFKSQNKMITVVKKMIKIIYYAYFLGQYNLADKALSWLHRF